MDVTLVCSRKVEVEALIFRIFVHFRYQPLDALNSNYADSIS